MQESQGVVVKSFGNLIEAEFFGNIRQGEICFVKIDPNTSLKGEVIEVRGKIAKIQVFEDVTGVRYHTPVAFGAHLLEAELGPGLLGTVFDGLQNPLESLAESKGLFLVRGSYFFALNREKRWQVHFTSKVGDILQRGDSFAYTMEGTFHHQIMIPFTFIGTCTLQWLASFDAYTVDTVIARAVDEQGEEHSFTMTQKWPVKKVLKEGDRISPEKFLETGLRIIDTQFPLLCGGTFCSPGPFGAGKTVLQSHLARHASVDIVVIVACGERAGEVVETLHTFPELKDPHTSARLIERTVIICNTSSMPVASREASIYMGVTIAEYYRQQGLDVLLIADSTSRWAQAMREISGRLEEIPGDEAFPAYLASQIAFFYERGGAIALRNGKLGSLTIGGTVSPAGGNFEEPVTQATMAIVGAFLALSSHRADARRYPAIDPLLSWSKYTGKTGGIMDKRSPGWSALRKRTRALLDVSEEIGRRMEVVGEEGVPLGDFITFLKGGLYEETYLQQNAFDPEDAYCPLNRQIDMAQLVQIVLDTTYSFVSRDEARSFFLKGQSRWKELHAASFESAAYKEAYQAIERHFSVHQEAVL